MSTLAPHLPHIPAFHAVMTTGSLSGAARLLNLAQPTVRRHIEALETALGAALFARSANGLTPTELAERLLPMAQAVLDQAAALGRAASAGAEDLAGRVRLTASRVAAAHILPGVLVPLQAACPGLEFEIAASDTQDDLASRAADIALRFAPPRQQNLRAQRLRDVEIGLFASPDLTLPAQITDLRRLPFISDDREDRILRGLAAAGLVLPERIVLRCDDPLTQIAHIQAGLGVGFCQVKLAARLGLRRVLPQIAHPMPAWLVLHEDQAQVPRIRRCFDHLRETLPLWM